MDVMGGEGKEREGWCKPRSRAPRTGRGGVGCEDLIGRERGSDNFGWWDGGSTILSMWIVDGTEGSDYVY